MQLPMMSYHPLWMKWPIDDMMQVDDLVLRCCGLLVFATPDDNTNLCFYAFQGLCSSFLQDRGVIIKIAHYVYMLFTVDY